MKIQAQYMTTNNSYDHNDPYAIIVHNTDNFAATATAKSHAEGLKNGYMTGMSWHVVVDDKEAYQCLPYKRGAWHIGVNYGNKTLFGKINNRNSICVEMCVNAGYNYEQAFLNTVDVVKQLMKELKIPADRVYQHYDICNKNCPSQIRAKGDWQRFKQLIGSESTDYDVKGDIQVDMYYRIRTTWDNASSQLNAYVNLQNAINNCPYGYYVFDWNGKTVYSPPKPAGTQSAEFNGLTEPQAAAKILALARDEGKRAHILTSLIAAQAILESGYCRTTELVKKSNNCFGMKCTLSGNTWPSAWDGVSKVKVKTPEQDPAGNTYYIYADFRKYPSIEKSFEDHSCYLLGAMNGSRRRYEGLTDCRTYKEAITLVKAGGYATDVNYVSKLCSIVERFELDKYDAEVAGSAAPADKYVVRKTWEDTASQTNSFCNLDYAKREADKYGYAVYERETGKEVYRSDIDRYQVSHNLDDKKYRVGLFHVLDNAKAAADENWGYKVYDVITGKLIYEPKLAAFQKLVAEAVYMDLIVRDDIKAGKKWAYQNKNTGTLSKTFDMARADKNYKTNCVTAIYWALLRAGVVNSNRDGIQWYGNNGFVWCNAHAKADALKYFNLITVRNKTVKKCIADGTLQPGDVFTYVKLSHTTMYVANGLTFDTGHHNCSGSGEGAKFKQWISAAGYQNYKVAEILRLK